MVKLEDYTTTELKKMISSFNKIVKFVGYSKKKKAELITMIRTHPKVKVEEGANAVKLSIKTDEDFEKQTKVKKEKVKKEVKKEVEKLDDVKVVVEKKEEPEEKPKKKFKFKVKNKVIEKPYEYMKSKFDNIKTRFKELSVGLNEFELKQFNEDVEKYKIMFAKETDVTKQKKVKSFKTILEKDYNTLNKIFLGQEEAKKEEPLTVTKADGTVKELKMKPKKKKPPSEKQLAARKKFTEMQKAKKKK